MLRWISKTEREMRAALRRTGGKISGATVAVILNDTGVSSDATVQHLIDLGFEQLVVFGGPAPTELRTGDIWVPIGLPDLASGYAAVNAVLSRARGAWVHYCYAGERLYYPYHETRSLGDFIGFVRSADRVSVQSVIVDTYTVQDIEQADFGTYHAEPRQLHRSSTDTSPKVKRFYGGMRARFSNRLTLQQQRIDRPALIRADRSVFLLPSGQFARPHLHSFANHRGPAPVATILSNRAEWVLRHNCDVLRDADFLCESSAPIDPSTHNLVAAGVMSHGRWI